MIQSSSWAYLEVFHRSASLPLPAPVLPGLYTTAVSFLPAYLPYLPPKLALSGPSLRTQGEEKLTRCQAFLFLIYCGTDSKLLCSSQLEKGGCLQPHRATSPIHLIHHPDRWALERSHKPDKGN